MGTKRIGMTPQRASWLNFCTLESVERKADRDILNPLVVRWWGPFACPAFPELDGDIDYVIQLDDRLDALAQSFYSDAFLWWVIAARNNIDDPVVALHMGEQIVIPDPVYVSQQFLSTGGRQGRVSR